MKPWSSLWLAGLVLVLGIVAVNTVAQQNPNDINIQFHAFQDTRGVTVLTPSADLNRDFTDRLALRLNVDVDAISAASDSCARCHREGINSHRQSFGLSMTRGFPFVKWTIGGAYSQENFYRATTLLTSASRDLAKGNTTVAGGFTFALNEPTLHPTQQIETQSQRDAFLSVTQTLSKTTMAQAGAELSSIAGYQNNPFLRANVNGVLVVGKVPDSRTRQTYTLRVRQSLPSQTYLQADYRYYRDDWQVRANSFSAGISRHLGEDVVAFGSYRWYTQQGAFFYQPEYQGSIPQYFTADYRLQPFTSGLVSGALTITPGRFLWFPPSSALLLQYERYRADNGFQAAIVSTGIRIPFSQK